MKKTTTIYFAILLMLYSLQSFTQQIAINEIMSSNSTTLTDEDGDYEDWIEIYNYGNSAVNLSGFGLSD